ncbi:DUF2000 domain-containing protein [Pokkaliibacter sp. CJK22405]|uniref:DUF2000 domain-containing protein n=1 Tax=Pokkaliibacter sp. CJK22405 TaxID=3384615 RepID=UPI003984D30E
MKTASPDFIRQSAELPERCVIILDQALPTGKAANAAAVMALSMGAQWPELKGDNYADASGGVHLGLIPIGIPILTAGQSRLQQLRSQAQEKGFEVVDFPEQGQQTTSYPDFIEAVNQTAAAELRYVGIVVLGKRNPISRLLKGLPLFGAVAEQ